jgi:hypothetical protein
MGNIIQRAKRFYLLRVTGRDPWREEFIPDNITILVEDDE